jgi:hypothetical protein
MTVPAGSSSRDARADGVARQAAVHPILSGAGVTPDRVTSGTSTGAGKRRASFRFPAPEAPFIPVPFISRRTTMEPRPEGMLSLTYWLVNDNTLVQRWQNPDNYEAIFNEYGITEAEGNRIIELNAQIRNRDITEVGDVVNAWIELLRPEMETARGNLW